MAFGLAARVKRLEMKHKKEAMRPKGCIGGMPEPYVEEINGVHYLRRPETPTGEAFAPWAARQQAELQQQLRELFADEDDPQPDAPYVGTNIDQPAPLPEGKKRARYVFIGEKEIEVATFKGFTR